MNTLKIFTLKIYCNLILLGYRELSWTERFWSFVKSFLAFSPVAFILGAVHAWYLENEHFFYAVSILVIINMVFGGRMHWKKRNFNIKLFLNKTSEMIISLTLIYLGLEMIISHGGDNYVTSGFRAALQMTSLLYPFSKIAKNVHILSKGKYPPEWIMKKLFDFEKTGDLKEFLDTPKTPQP
ncbi:hypothetical protein VS868_11900 [Salinimicrobium sp. 3283s]|uniref:hypothetical protein n=1 Tax=Salinimicrobium sp. 3283s TaxID=3114359 RepID=UPI0031EB089C